MYTFPDIFPQKSRKRHFLQRFLRKTDPIQFRFEVYRYKPFLRVHRSDPIFLAGPSIWSDPNFFRMCRLLLVNFIWSTVGNFSIILNISKKDYGWRFKGWRFKGGGVSDFWAFRGFLRLDKCRLEIFETHIWQIYLWSHDSIWQFSTTLTNHRVNRDEIRVPQLV